MLVPVQKTFLVPLQNSAHHTELTKRKQQPWSLPFQFHLGTGGAYTNKNAHSKIIPSTPLTCFHWRQSVTHKFSLGRVLSPVLPLASQSDSAASSQWAETQRHQWTTPARSLEGVGVPCLCFYRVPLANPLFSMGRAGSDNNRPRVTL